MKILFVLLGLTLSVAQASAGFMCTVTQVLDNGNFENINNFKFRDYKYVGLTNDGNSASLNVGALAFNSADSAVSVRGSRSYVRVEAQPANSDQVYKVVVIKRGPNKQKGTLSFSDRAHPEARVAALSCHQN